MADQEIIDLYDNHAPGACRMLAVASGAGAAFMVNSAWTASGAAAAAGATAASGGTIVLVAAGVLIGVVAARTLCPALVEKGRENVRQSLSSNGTHQYRFITPAQFTAFKEGLARYGTIDDEESLILARMAYATIEKNGPPASGVPTLASTDFAKAARQTIDVYREGLSTLA